jgi:hypothetical protein
MGRMAVGSGYKQTKQNQPRLDATGHPSTRALEQWRRCLIPPAASLATKGHKIAPMASRNGVAEAGGLTAGETGSAGKGRLECD